jgi:hypothetical protein
MQIALRPPGKGTERNRILWSTKITVAWRVPEGTRSLTSERSIDVARKMAGGRSGRTLREARMPAGGAGSFTTGEEPRRGRSTPGVEPGPSPSKTPRSRGGNGAQARCPSESSRGDDRPEIGGGAEAGGRAPGRTKPRRGSPSVTPSTSVAEDGLPGRQASGTRPRIARRWRDPGRRMSRFRRRPNVVEVTGPRKGVPADREDQTPEGRSPGALRDETGPGGLAGRKPPRGSKPRGRNVAGVGIPAPVDPRTRDVLKGRKPQERRAARAARKGGRAAGASSEP